MPFEPLLTDEDLPNRAQRERDMDTQMLFGCTGFVATSLTTYGLSVWPFLAFPRTHLMLTLAIASACAFVPALIFGAFASRRFSLPGACGFVSGAMATAIFLYLRLEQAQAGRTVRELPRPDYPASWTWMIPVAWLLLCLCAALVSVRIEPVRSQAGDHEPAARSDR